MAASNKEGNVSENVQDKLDSEDKSDDDSDLRREYGAEGTSGTENKPDSVPMFCKNCLNPYSGAQKSGTFVLKCTACGQTDTVLHEEAAELDPEEIVGNLMMNRYLQVLREQEDININIGDPDFIDDNFKGLNSAISDFCIYVNAIAERVLEIAREEKRDLEEKMFNADKTESICDSEGGLLDVDTGTTIPRDATEEIQTLRSSVLKVIAVLIRKYNLPADVWIGIERRIRNPEADEEDDDTSDNDDIKTLDDLEKSGTVTVNTLDKGRKSDSCESGAVGNISDIKSAQEGLTKSDDKVTSVGSVVSEPMAESITEENAEEPKTVFGMDIAEVRSTLDDEVLGKLGSKFKVHRGEDEDDKSGDDTKQPEPVDNPEGGEKENSTDDVLDKEIMQKLSAKIHFQREFPPDELDPIISSILTKTQCIKDTLAATNASSVENRVERKIMAGVSTGEAENEPKGSLKHKSEETTDMQKMVSNSDQVKEPVMTEDKNCEELEVSFQAVSNAFLHELQDRKKVALKQRKKKALTLVGARLIAIKHQIMDVERQIRRELHTAYERKLEKAENQKQMLAEKQIDIENVEDLLNHYIATGQMDKVAELMRIFNSANQDN